MRTTVPTTPTTPITLAGNQPRRGFITHPEPLPAAVLAADGRHADPAALIAAMSDADTRSTSTGLDYLAAHTQVPATFQAATDTTCAAHTWCTETGQHIDHIGRRIGLSNGPERPPLMEAYLYTDEPTGLPTLTFDPGNDNWQEYTSGDQLRAETARLRAHLARLDEFADEFAAIRQADDSAAAAEFPEPSALANAEAYLSSNPDALTPELAEALSIIVRTVKASGDPSGAARQLGGILTAEKRGPAWIAAHGCTPWCVMDHEGENGDGDPGWHQGPTAVLPAAGPLSVRRRANQTEPETDDEPLFAARVNTTNQDAEIFGTTTTLWVDVPGDTMELTLAQTDRLIDGLEKFLPQLRALRVLQAEAEKDDHPGDTALKATYMAKVHARSETERAGGAL